MRIALTLALLVATPAAAQRGSSIVNGREHDGESLACDLPGTDHMRNRGGTDGAGMCVLTSIEMAARWAGMEDWRGVRDYWANRERGGGYPQKVDRQLKAYAKAKGLQEPLYVQYEGRDPGPLLDLCDRTGRMACITYGTSPRYRGTIAHMTNAPKFSGKYGVCLDNNFPGENAYEWMSRDELVRRIKHPSGSAWVFVWLSASPPPVPRN